MYLHVRGWPDEARPCISLSRARIPLREYLNTIDENGHDVVMGWDVDLIISARDVSALEGHRIGNAYRTTGIARTGRWTGYGCGLRRCTCGWPSCRCIETQVSLGIESVIVGITVSVVHVHVPNAIAECSRVGCRRRPRNILNGNRACRGSRITAVVSGYGVGCCGGWIGNYGCARGGA